MSDQFLPIGQAAEFLGVSIDTLRRWEKNGKIASKRIGKNRYFRVLEIERIKFGESVSIGEAARRLNIPTSTIRRLSNQGLIASHKATNGYRQYKVKDLEVFVSANQREVLQAQVIDPASPSVRTRLVQLSSALSQMKLMERFSSAVSLTIVASVLSVILLIGGLTLAFLADPGGTSDFFGFENNNQVLGISIDNPKNLLASALQEPAKTAVQIARAINPEKIANVVIPETSAPIALNGEDGEQGPQGEIGQQGVQGEAGTTGAKGDTGTFSTNYSSSGGLNFNPYGTSSGNTTELRFYELYANGTEYVGFEAQDSIASSQIWKLPASDGTAEQCLTTDGDGTLLFDDCLSSALASLNGLTGSIQTFATGTSGTDFAISSSGTTHTFNIPDAGSSTRGLITTGTQTIAGAKTFSSNLNADGGLDIDDVFTIADGGLSATVSDNFWMGLGSSSGNIEFDDQTTDEVNILNSLVGIGTSTPGTVLDIAGSVTAAASGQVAGLTVSSTLTGRSNTSDVYYGISFTPTMVAGANTQTLTGLYVAPTYNDNSKTGVVHYDAIFNGDGDVVIGNSTKWSADTGARLSVQDSSSAGAVNLDFKNNASVAVGNELRMRFYNYSTQTDNNASYISSIVTNSGTGASDVAFGVWGGGIAGVSEAMRIISGGNVGIGDTSADAKLEVLGTSEQLRLTYTDGTIDSRISVDSSGNLTIDGSSDGTGSETLTLTGFSTLTASSLTSMSVADEFWVGLGGSAARIEFDDQTTDEVNILSSNVGIGTSDPERKLHVVGGSNSGILMAQGGSVSADSSLFYNGLVFNSGNSYGMGVNSSGNFELNFKDSGSIYQNFITIQADSGYTGIGTSGVASAKLEIEDNGGTAILIDENGNGISLDIDAESTSADILNISGAPLTTGYAIDIPDLDALTTGRGLNIVSNSSSTSTRRLVSIVNDNSAATGTTPLYIQEDAPGTALSLVQNFTSTTGTHEGIQITGTHTLPTSGSTHWIGMDVDIADSLTTGASTTHSLWGLDVSVYADSDGSSTVHGIYVDIGGGDTNYAATFFGGLVGVGTDTPTNDLELWDTDTDGDTHFFVADSTPGSTAATAPCIKMGATTTGVGICNLSDDLVFFESGSSMGTEAMRLQGGSLGLGDTGPDAKLEVLGTSEQLRLTYTDGTVDSRISVDSSGNFTIDGSTDGTGSQTFTLTGYSTITASSLTSMTIADNFYLGLGASAARIEFDDQTTDEVNILSANVGLGVSDPDEALEVSGAIHASNAIYTSKKTFAYDPDSVTTIYTQYLGTFHVGRGPVEITIYDNGFGHGAGSFFRVTRHFASTPVVHLQNIGLNGASGAYTIYYRTIDDDSYELFFDDADSSGGNTINYTAYINHQAAVESDTISASNDTDVNAATVALMTNHVGDVGIGTILPAAKLQVTGGGLCVGSDANCNSDNDTEGTVYSSNTAMTVYDVAENYPTKDDSLVWGEIVSLDTSNGVFVKRADTSREKMIGVISKEPAVLLGGFNGAQFKEEKQVAVGLSGRILVKVSLEGGAIAVGDELTISSTAGVAKKANKGEQIIGFALENYTSQTSEGTIQFFIALDRAIEAGAIAGLNGATSEPQVAGISTEVVSEERSIIADLETKIHDIQKRLDFKFWESMEELVFSAAKVVFKGHIAFNSDTVGTVTIPANATKVKVIFSKPFEAAPIVNLTLTKSGLSYVLNEVSEQSFVITLSEAQTEEIVFNWTAFLSEGENTKVEVLESVSASPVPVATPHSSPTPVATESALLQ